VRHRGLAAGGGGVESAEGRMIDEADRHCDGELPPFGDAGHEGAVDLLDRAGAP
jgi:hypothetical protein